MWKPAWRHGGRTGREAVAGVFVREKVGRLVDLALDSHVPTYHHMLVSRANILIVTSSSVLSCHRVMGVRAAGVLG